MSHNEQITGGHARDVGEFYLGQQPDGAPSAPQSGQPFPQDKNTRAVQALIDSMKTDEPPLPVLGVLEDQRLMSELAEIHAREEANRELYQQLLAKYPGPENELKRLSEFARLRDPSV